MAFEKSQNIQAPIRKLGTSKKIDPFSLDTKAIGAFPGGLEVKSLSYKKFYNHLAWLQWNNFGNWSTLPKVIGEFPNSVTKFHVVNFDWPCLTVVNFKVLPFGQ